MATYSYLKSRPKVNGSYVGLSDEEVEAFHPVVHPAVITHPETHKKSIFASEADTTDLIGLPEAESESMLALLANQVKKPEFVYIHKWNDNDLVIWDNRGKAKLQFPLMFGIFFAHHHVFCSHSA